MNVFLAENEFIVYPWGTQLLDTAAAKLMHFFTYKSQFTFILTGSEKNYILIFNLGIWARVDNRFEYHN
jgi:hypothetical protein